MLLTAVILSLTGPAGADEPIHKARTAAESALQTLIDGPRPAATGFAILGMNRRKPEARAFLGKLTPALVASIERTERRLSREQCGGRLHGDGYCGLDIDLIACSNGAEPDRFETRRSSDSEALIASYDHRNPDKPVGLYQLRLQGGVWKLDGIRCANSYLSFNIT